LGKGKSTSFGTRKILGRGQAGPHCTEEGGLDIRGGRLTGKRNSIKKKPTGKDKEGAAA